MTSKVRGRDIRGRFVVSSALLILLMVAPTFGLTSPAHADAGAYFASTPGRLVLNYTDAESGYSAFASVVRLNSSTLFVYYTYRTSSDWTSDSIALAISNDNGASFQKQPIRPLVAKDQLWKSAATWCPDVWLENGTFYMLYVGSTGLVTATGLATSADDGVHFTDSPFNPVLQGTNGTWDANGLEAWGVMKFANGTYVAYYNNFLNPPRKVGIAYSDDLIHWTKDPNDPIFSNPSGVYCGCPFVNRGRYYLLLPTNGPDDVRIELYGSGQPDFPQANRTDLGTMVVTNSSWIGFDTPFVQPADVHRIVADSFDVYYTGIPYGTPIREDLTYSLAMTFSLAMGSPTVPLTIMVTDSADGSHVKAASVVVRANGTLGTGATDDDGLVTIQVAPLTPCSITVYKSGYESTKRQIMVGEAGAIVSLSMLRCHHLARPKPLPGSHPGALGASSLFRLSVRAPFARAYAGGIPGATPSASVSLPANAP